MQQNRFFNPLLAILVSSVLVACGGETDESPKDPSARPVKIVEISDGSNESTARYPAVIGAGDSADLRFAIGGVVAALPVTESGDVSKGDLIARLDTRDLRNNLESAQASYSNAEEEYQRAVRLAEQDAIATSVLEQREAQRDVAKAQLDSAEKALSDSEIVAPFDGVIASVPASEGNTVGPGEIVATLIGVDTLEATISLPASVISQVPTRENRGAAVLLDAAPDQLIEATFSEANLLADATSQTYSVTFTFDAPENLLVLPGMNATVVLRSTGSDDEAASVTVPLAAVQSDGDGQYVWVVNPESMAVSRRGIEVAPGIGETLVVTSGLTSGEQIVGAGGAYLAEGMQVTPWTE